MIIRAIELGITVDQIDYLKKLYTFNESDEFYKEWVKWDDERLNVMICSDHTPDGYAKEIFSYLKNRTLFKRLFSENLTHFNPLVRDEISQNLKGYRKEIEEKIGKYLDNDARKIIVNSFKVQSVRAQSRNEDEPIMVSSTYSGRFFKQL
jgi:hypothetical protein